MAKGDRANLERVLRKAWELKTRQPVASLSAPPSLNSKSLTHRLFLFFEHPLFLGAIGIVGGLVGLLFYTPTLLICGACVLLAFHRAAVVADRNVRTQVMAYLLVAAISGSALYGLRSLIKSHAPDIGKEIADQIVERQKREPKSERLPPDPSASLDAGFGDSSEGPFKVRFAGNLYEVTTAYTAESPSVLLGCAGKGFKFPCLSAYIDKNKIFFDAQLFSGGGRFVTVKKNVIVNNELNWDRNFDKSAFEIVDQDKIPMLQIVYETSNVVTIYGIFPGPPGQGVIVATQSGITFNPDDLRKVEGYPLKRLFHYPSRKDQGEEVSD